VTSKARLGVLPDGEMLESVVRRVTEDVGSYRCTELAGLVNAMARMADKGKLRWPYTLLFALQNRTIEVGEDVHGCLHGYPAEWRCRVQQSCAAVLSRQTFC
jgi:hypothetical protein